MTEDFLGKELAAIPEEAFKALQEFVDKRGRPAVFLLLAEHIGDEHVLLLRSWLRDKKYDELDVVIHSVGGDIHSAYLIIALLRLHAKKLNACVPRIAKSAATLLCLGANKIVLDEIAQLGPLDTQIVADRALGSDIVGSTSALHPFKTLEHIREFSLTSLSEATGLLCNVGKLSMEESLPYALNFVGKTTAPLYDQLEPQNIGIYSRALSVGEEYGKRILMRFHHWEEEEANKTIRKIIHEYPSHHYIIDLHELKQMRLKAELFPDDQRDVVDGVFGLLDSKQSIVTCVEPTKPKAGRSRRHEAANRHQLVEQPETA